MSTTHHRVTGAVRLLLAAWLIVAAVRILADPQGATVELGAPLTTLLPFAGLWFALGAFLLTGFMSRVCGLLLVGMGIWQAGTFGLSIMPVALVLAGVYFALRGGGAWAMDVYVQRMQDRARQKEAMRLNSPESSSPPSRG